MTTRHTSTALPLVLDGLASYRLVKLLRDDRVAEPLRTWVHDRYGDVEHSRATYLLQCPWCLSIWFGAGLTLARRRWPGPADAVARVLAISAFVGLADQATG